MDLLLFLRLEETLLDKEVRRNPDRAGALLSDAFREFGSSGRVFSKAAILEALAAETPSENSLNMENFEAVAVGEGVVLVTYRSVRRDGRGVVQRRALRSSLWVLEGTSWRIRFHQGTLADEVT